MAEYNINKIKLPNGDIVKLVDETSGYTKNTGTVTSVGLQNSTNGGLSVTGSPVTGSGTISVGHSNVLTNAQTTQALYPIAIDKNGHISSYGTAVDPEDIFLFEITGIQSQGSSDINYTTTATPAQISDALSEGKVPVAKVTNFGISGYHYFSMAFEESNSFHYLFVASYDGGDSFTECIATSATASSFTEIYVSVSDYSYASHVHGNITTDGKISSTAVTPGNGDYILISDSSGSNKIERGIAIGTGTTKYLREDGTWQTITSGVSDVKINNTSIVSSGVANIVTNTAYNSSTNKIATMSDIPSITSTYSSTGTTAVNGKAVNAALQTLDSSITATTGQAISAITITDGKIASSSKISVGEANLVTDVQINGTSILSSKVANLITNTAYNSSTNKIATMSDITDSDKVFVVNVTLTSLTGGTSDKSSTDIYNAARAGKMVIAKVPYNGVQMVAVLVAAARDTSDDIAVFQYQNQKPSGLLSSFGFAKLTIVMNTVAIEAAAADAATLGGTYLYSGGSANDGITLAAENGIDINYLSQSPLCNGNVYTLRHTNAVSATTGNAAVYPITIDAQGHISSYGSAVTIPAAVAVKGNAESSYRTGNVNLTPANLGISATTSSVTVGSTTFTNTDTMVTNTASNTTKYYVTGTTSSSTNTGTQYFDTGIYATTTAGQLQATSYKVTANATIQYNSTDSSVDFTFI